MTGTVSSKSTVSTDITPELIQETAVSFVTPPILSIRRLLRRGSNIMDAPRFLALGSTHDAVVLVAVSTVLTRLFGPCFHICDARFAFNDMDTPSTFRAFSILFSSLFIFIPVLLDAITLPVSGISLSSST